jgi:hypothetical protein
MQYQTRSSDTGKPAIATLASPVRAGADSAPTRAGFASDSSRPHFAHSQLQGNHASAGHVPTGSLLMSSAWLRLVGALAMIGLLWLAVAWALAEVAA